MFDLERMIVAAEASAEENTTESAIAALRDQLTGSGETRMAPDGTALPSDASGADASSMKNGGYKPVDKAVVAADHATANMIESLRNQLTGDGETLVNADGTVMNPADPATTSSLTSGDGYKPVDKAVVAAASAADAERAALAEELRSGASSATGPDGSVGEPSSLEKAEHFMPVPKCVTAAPQWYETNPGLQKLEIQAMHEIQPEAKPSYLPNGKMCWTIHLHPVICGRRKDWTLLAVYDSDHPQQRWGGSVKFYPVKPNYSEMMQAVQASRVTPKNIPHLLPDEDHQLYMCTQEKDRIHAGRRKGEKVTTAAAGLRFAMRWISVFELGLLDQKTWSLFQQHGKI